MNIVAFAIGLCLCLSPTDKTVPKAPLGKDTTVATGPLDKDGYVDYEAALNDRLKKGVTPETNANVLLLKVFGPRPEGANLPAEYYKQLGVPEPPEKGDYAVWLGPFLRNYLKLNAEQIDVASKQHDLARQRPWAGNAYPHINAWLIVNEKQLALVIEATKRPEYFNPMASRRADGGPSSLIGALLPTAQKSRELANMLIIRAMLRVQEGKVDEAWHDLLACHRLAGQVGRGACIIELLVAVAIDSMACNADLVYLEHAKLTAAQVRDCLKDLKALPAMPQVADKIDLCERFLCLDCLQMVRRNGIDGIGLLIGGQVPAAPAGAQEVLERIDWAPVYRNVNRWYDRLTAAIRLPDRAERAKALEAIEDELLMLKRKADPNKVAGLLRAGAAPEKEISQAVGDIVLSMVMPATQKLANARDRVHQIRQNTQLAFALAAFRLDHGRYPGKLDDLAPKYLLTIPNDLFSGKALIYRPTENGYLFYSVGVNGKDEDGRWTNDDPPGDDLRVRMPTP